MTFNFNAISIVFTCSQTLKVDEEVNGRRFVKRGQLFLSNKNYDVSRSSVEITFLTKDEAEKKEIWRPYRQQKLYKVLKFIN